ncbi:GNAT family N-acetyltransferase [Hellea sp.]|nr:GNAT family N-acetyltransferase [Hellea sp.]
MTKANTNTVLSGLASGGAVVLRHPRWADYEAWSELRKENRDYLTPWEPQWGDNHLTRLSYRARLARFKKMVNNDEAYPFHIFRASDERLIGGCNITSIQRQSAQAAQLGYWVGEHYARQGFARASVSAATKFCFQTLGLHRIEAGVQADNAASIKVLKAMGFQREGTARGYLKINGKWEDHDIYAKLSSD